MSALGPARHRFEALDGLRGVAAVAVLLYHAGQWVDSPWLVRHGYLAVDLFFCLSGFVLASSYERRLQTTMTFVDFAWRRVVRLWPLLIASMVLGATHQIATIIVRDPSEVVTFTDIARATGLGLLLMPALVGVPEPYATHLFPINTPAWSLMLEVGVNLAWALLVRRLGLRALVAALVVSGVFFVWFSALDGSGDFGWAPRSFIAGWSRVTVSFTMGVLLYRLHQANRSPLRLTILGPASILLAMLCVPPLAWDAAFDVVVVLAVLPTVVLLGASSTMGNGALAQTMRIGGEISYPLYVLHYPAWLLTERILAKFGVAATLPVVLAFCLTMIAVAWLALKLFDEPLRAWLSRARLFSKPRAAVWVG